MAHPTSAKPGSSPETAADAAVEDDTLLSKLRELGVDDEVANKIIDELGAETEEDLALANETELVGCGMKPLAARKLRAALNPVAPALESGAFAPVSFDGILPTVPDDGAWMDALKTGGVSKVNTSTVISAIRAALANRVGLYDVPGKLAKAMETYADESEEQVDPVFFSLRNQLTRRNYAEVFSAIEGLDGNFVTDARKNQLFVRINTYLWPAIIDFYDQLQAWQDNWTKQGANPAMLMAIVASAGRPGMPMPPNLMQPPETTGLRDYADSVSDAVNRVFAGTGVQISAALAYEAKQIKTTLEDPRLPAMIGTANREQMLKKLGVSVSSTYPRLENNLTRFVLAIMQVKDQPAGNEELQYFGSLFMLGSQIPWAELGGGRRPAGVTAIGGRTSL
jgi:hypothetical protein